MQHPPSFHASTSTPLTPFRESLNKIASDVSVIKQNIKTILESNVTSKTISTLVAKTNPNEDICMQRNDDVEIVVAKVTLARSIKEIESAGFIFDEKKEELFCSICGTVDSGNNDNSTDVRHIGVFKHEKQTGMTFNSEENLPDQFRNLKKLVKRHIKQSTTRIKNIQSQIKKQKEAEKAKSKNYEAGMNIGRLCYKLFVKGRPFSEFEKEVLILNQANANVGNLNHSRKFPSAFLSHVFNEIRSRMKQFLTSKLPQTGHRPRAVARTLIGGGGGVYSYIHVLPD